MKIPFKTPIQVADGGVLIAADAELIFRAESATPEELAFIVAACNAYAPMRATLEDAANLIEGAIETHIYDTDNGDVIPKDCGYTGCVEDIRALLAGTAEQRPAPADNSDKEIPVCSTCGSDNVQADAYVAWSVEDQRFSEVVAEFPNYVCEGECGGECSVTWVKPSERKL